MYLILFLQVIGSFGSSIESSSRTNNSYAKSRPSEISYLNFTYLSCSGNCQLNLPADKYEEEYFLQLQPNSKIDIILNTGRKKDDFEINLMATSPISDFKVASFFSQTNCTNCKYTISESVIEDYSSKVIHVYASNLMKTPVDIEFTESTFPVWAFVIIGFGGAIVFLFIFRVLWKRKRRMTSHQRSNQMQANNREIISDKAKDYEIDIQDNFEKYFHEAGFENLKTSFSETNCSICLELFNTDSKCLQLECNHIFHTECVKIWITTGLLKNKKACCPNCKKEVIISTIKIALQ